MSLRTEPPSEEATRSLNISVKERGGFVCGAGGGMRRQGVSVHKIIKMKKPPLAGACYDNVKMKVLL
jgi:hypothetical protein